MDISKHMQVHHKSHQHETPDETNVDIKDNVESSMLRGIDDSTENGKKTKFFIFFVYVVLVLIGVGTGYVLATGKVGSNGLGVTQTTSSLPQSDKSTAAFRDSAEGVIEKGGIDGEGTHKLIREGGPSQTAFLVSSVVDLDAYVGKKVKVWGETFDAKKASWLMDVGKIEVLK